MPSLMKWACSTTHAAPDVFQGEGWWEDEKNKEKKTGLGWSPLSPNGMKDTAPSLQGHLIKHVSNLLPHDTLLS